MLEDTLSLPFFLFFAKIASRTKFCTKEFCCLHLLLILQAFFFFLVFLKFHRALHGEEKKMGQLKTGKRILRSLSVTGPVDPVIALEPVITTPLVVT